MTTAQREAQRAEPEPAALYYAEARGQRQRQAAPSPRQKGKTSIEAVNLPPSTAAWTPRGIDVETAATG